MRDRYAYVLFCDDIRRERTNTSTYVGLYGTTLRAPEFPHLLPRLCVQTVLVCNASTPPERVKVIITTSAFREEHEISAELMAQHKERCARILQDETSIFSDDEPPKSRIGATFVISPMVFEGEGRLLVHVETESERLRAGSLNILSRSEKKPSSPAIKSSTKQA